MTPRCFQKEQDGKEGSNTGKISQYNAEMDEETLFRELTKYDSMGIPLFLNGRRRSPRSIARACKIAEGGGYMRDYSEDQEGRISRVDFDYIEDPEKYKR